MPDDLEWQLCERRGLKIPNLRALTQTLETDLRPEDWGYGQLGDIRDVEQRAIVSDQLIASIIAARTNLVELALSLAEYHELSAPGLRIPRKEHWIEDFELHQRAEMAQVAVFRAIGSVLDCMAAVAIVILRIPRAPTYADVRDLDRIPPLALRHAEETLARDSLNAVAQAVENQLTAGLLWALEMRNAVIHRGRQIAFLLPRPDTGSLAIATHDPLGLAQERAQADLYFHRRPWLPEMEHLADAKAGIAGQWINEPAQITMQALKDDLVDLINELSGALREVWTGPGASGELSAPIDKWILRAPPSLDFVGYAPAPAYAPLAGIHLNPATARRVEIADQLRRRRL